jgi:hypothetical protein
MSSLSLEASIKTNKVNTGLAHTLHSQKYMDPKHMSCPIHTGLDTAGRKVHSDSFNTKTAGCHSPMDRVSIENDVTRPSYTQMIGHNAHGINGDIYETERQYGHFGHVNNNGHHVNSNVHNGHNYFQDGYEQGIAHMKKQRSQGIPQGHDDKMPYICGM